MKKTALRLGRKLPQTRIQQIALVLTGVLVIGGISYVGTMNKRSSHAAVAAGTLYMTPTSGNFAPGSTVSVDIRESSGTDPVLDVQAGLVYNPAQLRFVDTADGTAFPPSNNRNDATTKPGELLMFRGVSSSAAAVTGDNLVATVHFQVLATAGTTTLSFNNGDSLIFGTNENGNMMTNSIGGTFNVKFDAPTISSITPATGSTLGGSGITITGTGFRGGASVTVGGIAATNVVVVSATQITATTPAHVAGAVPVVVFNSDQQQATSQTGFTYASTAPTISSLTPVTGPTTGGTTVTVTGTNFVQGARVVVATVAATSVNVVSSTQLTFVTPSIGTGSSATVLANVTITNPDNQSASKTNAFTYVAPVPVVTSSELASRAEQQSNLEHCQRAR
jgi:hypothetical protein